MNESYKVKLDGFEGPLDLLLHLINELEIDIYDIPVAEITEQYMHYINTMQFIELNVASEYLVMAATLLEMKSTMLLPKKEVEYEEEYEEDPREALIQQLIEYRKYKIAASSLQEKELEENQIYTRPPVQFKDLVTEQPVVQGDISIYDMLHALNKVFKRQSWNAPLDTTVNKVDVSIDERMNDIVLLVEQSNERIPFDRLFMYPSRGHIVITFLAILQLLKNNQIDCVQTAQFEPIFLCKMEVS